MAEYLQFHWEEIKIQPTYNRDDDGPVAVQEVLISKYDDKSPSGEDYSFVFDGNSQSSSGHSGAMQVGLSDGSVRLVASGPGDESPFASGPGDEITVKAEYTAADDSFAVDWLAEDHAPSDPSDGLLPMESLRPVDPSDPSHDLQIAEFTFGTETPRSGGGEVAMESITLVHEGFELLI